MTETHYRLKQGPEIYFKIKIYAQIYKNSAKALKSLKKK